MITNLTQNLIATHTLWLVLLFAGATLCERYMPTSMLVLGMLVVAVLLPLAIAKNAVLHTPQALVIGIAAGALVWITCVGTLTNAPVSVHWKSLERCIAIVIAVVIMTSDVPIKKLLAGFSAAGSAAMLVAIVPMWWFGGFQSSSDMERHEYFFSYGMGHPNQLMNTAGLAALGYALLVYVQWRKGLPVKILEIALAIAGVLAVVVMAFETSRRGIGVAAMSGLFLLAVDAAWRRSRILAMTLLGLAMLGVAVAGTYAIYSMTYNVRMERGLIYMSSWSYFLDHWLTGSGHYASRLIQFSANDACARYNALGIWGFHAHNELLDALLDGGIIAGLALIAGCVVVVKQSLFNANAPVRSVLIFLTGGALAVSLFDNAYSRLIGEWWVAVLVGLVFNSQLQPSLASVIMSNGLLRIMAWCVAIASAFASVTQMRSAFMASDATPAVHVRVVENIYEPELLHSHCVQASSILLQEENHAAVEYILNIERRRIGLSWSGIESLIHAKSILDRPRSDIASLLRTLSSAAIFDKNCHLMVAELVGKVPEERGNFPPEVLERMMRWSNKPMNKVAFPMPPPTSAKQAALQLAEISWCLSNQRESQREAGQALGILLDMYGNSGQCALVAFMYLRDVESPGFDLDMRRTLIMDRSFPEYYRREMLDSITAEHQVRRLKFFLGNNCWRQIADLEELKLTRGFWVRSDSGLSLWKARLRIAKEFKDVLKSPVKP